MAAAQHTHHLKNGRDKMNEPQGFLMRECSTYCLMKKNNEKKNSKIKYLWLKQPRKF